MKLFSILALLAMTSFAQSARADSFNCDSSAAEHVYVRVQDHVHAIDGTRSAAIVLVTDTNQDYGSRTLISSTDVAQNGADWTVPASDIGSNESATLLGDYALDDISQAQILIPGFDFNEGAKDEVTYTGHLYLYVGGLSMYSQDITLSCVYLTKN
jgi:hypothetical protein